MGPGMLIKAVLQGSFSLMVFGWAQIVMDVQPLIVLLSGEGQLHGFSHTFIGATLLGAFSVITGKHLAEWGLRMLGISKRDNPVQITWRVTALSAFLGTYSHVVLDAIMHSDVEPWYPLSPTNEFLGALRVSQLHELCLYTGIIGGFLYLVTQLASKHSTRRPRD